MHVLVLLYFSIGCGTNKLNSYIPLYSCHECCITTSSWLHIIKETICQWLWVLKVPVADVYNPVATVMQTQQTKLLVATTWKGCVSLESCYDVVPKFIVVTPTNNSWQWHSNTNYPNKNKYFCFSRHSLLPIDLISQK